MSFAPPRPDQRPDERPDVRERSNAARQLPLAPAAPGRAPKAAHSDADELRLILDQLTEAVISVDAAGRMRSMNPAGERLFGLHRGEALGRQLRSLLPQFAASGNITRELRRLAAVRPDGAAPESRDFIARHALGYEFALQLAVHQARSGRRELFVVCAREAAKPGGAERRESPGEERYRALYETVMEGIYRSTPAGRLTEVNPAFVRMLGYDTAAQLYALPSAALLYWNPAERADFARELEQGGELRSGEFRLRRRDGTPLVVLESARVLRDAAGAVFAYEGTIADITARKHAEEAIAAEKERAEVTLQSIGDAVITADSAGRIEYMNPVAEQLTGWTLAQMQGRCLDDALPLVNDATRERLPGPLSRMFAGGGSPGPLDQSVLIDRAGNDVAVQESAAPIRDRSGALAGAVVVLRDVGRERRLRRALAYQATHDALTGLINRREFDRQLQLALDAARQQQLVHVLLYIDLDQFKIVNDSCGHSAGDRLIREITSLIQARVRSSDVIARLGGDEFGVLLLNTSLDQAGTIAEAMRQAVRDYRFEWADTTLGVGASIGLVEITAQTDSVATVLSAADVACYTAKERGRNRTQVYEAGSGKDLHREMHWVAELTRAIDAGRLELQFQPIVAVSGDPRLHFSELTVRMIAANGEIVLPEQFIPAAERYNVMARIDLWVLREAAGYLRRLPAAETPPLFAIKVSGNSLGDAQFAERVLEVIGDADIARSLCFELTETAVATHRESAVHFASRLRRHGCRVSLDDFGSGLSSFRVLKDLPVDFLKIDGQLVAQVATEAVDRSMIEAIVQVGRALGIATIAEKVENDAALQELARIGVGYAQGFALARPQPMSQFATWRAAAASTRSV